MGVWAKSPPIIWLGPFPIQINHRGNSVLIDKAKLLPDPSEETSACWQPDGTRSIFPGLLSTRLDQSGLVRVTTALPSTENSMDARRHPRQPFPSPACSPPPSFSNLHPIGQRAPILLDLGIRLDQIFLGPLEITNKLQAGFPRPGIPFPPWPRHPPSSSGRLWP